jgi:hypothetical protein
VVVWEVDWLREYVFITGSGGARWATTLRYFSWAYEWVRNYEGKQAVSMWGAEEYRQAASQATDRRTREALAEEAERIERREQVEPGSTSIRITIEVPRERGGASS